MKLRVLAIASLMLLLLSTVALAQGAARVDKFLEEIDEWVLTDTTKILAYIDSCNAVTTAMLESSQYWQPVMTDLSFLLGIDYVGSPQIDNTGRIYFLMRITGESEALFYIDGPMGWPTQITPNNWSEEGFKRLLSPYFSTVKVATSTLWLTAYCIRGW